MKKVKDVVTNKKFIISVVVIIFLLGISVGYFIYDHNKKQAEINDKIDEIGSQCYTFIKLEDRDEKLGIIKSLKSDYNKYKKTDNADKKLLNEYEGRIKELVKLVTKDYDDTIVANTLKNIDEIENVDEINTAKINLESLLETIKSEKDVICDGEEVVVYSKKINELLDSYNRRISAIDEATIRTEEERLAREFANVDQQQAIINDNSNGENSNDNDNAVEFKKMITQQYGCDMKVAFALYTSDLYNYTNDSRAEVFKKAYNKEPIYKKDGQQMIFGIIGPTYSKINSMGICELINDYPEE